MKSTKAIPLILCALSGVPRAEAAVFYVGNGAPNQTNNITSGTNSYASTIIGNTQFSTNNLLTIANNGTLLSNSFNLYVGKTGAKNSLSISNAGTLINSTGYIGYDSGSSNNSALVTGTHSLWSNSSFLYVGYDGSGNSLTISNAGTVTDFSGYIGYDSGSSNNTVLVTGAGSLWSNFNRLNVGYSGSGTLTISSGGAVVASSIVIALNSGSIGTINIGSLGGSDTAGTSPLITPSIAFGNGSGTINFNQSDSTTITSSISDNGTLNQLGSGTTILSGSNSITGTTTISSGTLLVNSNLGSGMVNVNSGGTLAGTGTVGGPVSVSGNLGGIGLTNTLSLTNTLTLNSGSTTTFNIAATNSFDSLKVAGVITYGGGLIFNIGMNSTFDSGSSFGIFTDLSGGTNISIANAWSSVTLTNASQSWSFIPDGNGNWYSTNNASIWQFSDANGVLSVSAVPEPTTFALFGIGALVLIVVTRRKIA